VELENVFRRIHTNSANLFHGRPPLSEIYSDLILARLMPSGGRPHQQKKRHPLETWVAHIEALVHPRERDPDHLHGGTAMMNLETPHPPLPRLLTTAQALGIDLLVMHGCLTRLAEMLAESRGALAPLEALADRLNHPEQRQRQQLIRMQADLEKHERRLNADFRRCALAQLHTGALVFHAAAPANGNHDDEERDLDSPDTAGVVVATQQKPNLGGRPTKYDWEAFLIEAQRLEWDGGIQSRAHLCEHMAEWVATHWSDPPSERCLRKSWPSSPPRSTSSEELQPVLTGCNRLSHDRIP
jgi:hypothetical protein